jgi:hypothetical protein
MWIWLAGYVDGDGFFRAFLEPETERLHAEFHITDAARSALEVVREFILKETGFTGRIVPHNGAWRLTYTKVSAVYAIAKHVQPYLQLVTRKKQVDHVLQFIPAIVKERLKKYRELRKIRINLAVAGVLGRYEKLWKELKSWL